MDTRRRDHHTFLTDPWWKMGQAMPDAAGLRVNETATRARAGLLNLLSAATIFLLVAAPEVDPVLYVGPYVIFDMFAAAALGLTPLSPTGVLGTLMTMRFRPVWKPSQPKRFAWILGGSLGLICFAMRLGGVDRAWIIGVVGICFVLTWLEAVLGFCVGCWMYSLMFDCEDCEIPYRRPRASRDPASTPTSLA
ncbi:MAG: DUF4395 domain-containing protein [Isosphaeraceae bacterium]|nr:DUF4395 domain-containing protein [Isosphaeraceae bacterium]